MSGSLTHLTVVDLTDELGAIAGRMLAELGAVVRRTAAGSPAWNHGKQPLDPGEVDAALAQADIVLRAARSRS